MTEQTTVITGYYDHNLIEDGESVRTEHCVIGFMAARKGILMPDIGDDGINEDGITSSALIEYRLAIQQAYNISSEDLEGLQEANDSKDPHRLNERLKACGITDFEVWKILQVGAT